MNHSTTVGSVVRTIRRKLELSQAELARRAHLARSTVSSLETGRNQTVSLDSLEAIAKTLSVPVRELLPDSEESPMGPPRKRPECGGEFMLDYPESGLKILSYLPRGSEIFVGQFWIRANKELLWNLLPQTEMVFLQTRKGILLISWISNQMVLKEHEHLVLDGRVRYSLYNPHSLEEVKIFMVTFHSFFGEKGEGVKAF